MRELFLMIANLTSREDGVSLLDKALSEYKKGPSDENYARLATTCMFLAAKIPLERDGLDGVIKDFEKMEAGRNLLDPNKFKS